MQNGCDHATMFTIGYKAAGSDELIPALLKQVEVTLKPIESQVKSFRRDTLS